MKKMHIKSAIPIYAAAIVWLIAGFVAPKMLLELSTLLIVAAISFAAALITGKFFPGRTIEVREEIRTGDAALDADIAEGRTLLEKLHKANEAIEHPEISRNLDRMTRAGEQIFHELGRDKNKYALVRKFMNYYLPTAEKLMDQYQILMSAPMKGENIKLSMARIENSLGMIADAFEKYLDNLYADQEMDIDAEIKVMQTVLSGDGLIDGNQNDIYSMNNEDQRSLSMGGQN